MKAQTQKSHSGLMSAISTHETAEKTDENATRYVAFVFFTRNPVATFVRIPQTTVGRKRSEVCRGERDCTSWKLDTN